MTQPAHRPSVWPAPAVESTWEQRADEWGRQVTAPGLLARAEVIARAEHQAYLDEKGRELDRLEAERAVAQARAALSVALIGPVEHDRGATGVDRTTTAVDRHAESSPFDDGVDRSAWSGLDHAREIVEVDPSVGRRVLADELSRRLGTEVTRYRASQLKAELST